MGRGRGTGRAALAAPDRARRLAALRHSHRRVLGDRQRRHPSRPGLDHRPRGEVSPRRRDRLLPVARVPRRREQLARRRLAADLSRPREVRGHRRALHHVRRRKQRLVPHLGRRRDRQVAPGGHRAQRDRVLQERADPVFAVPELSAVQRAQERISHPGVRIEQPARIRGRASLLSEPRSQLRRDPAGAADDAARTADGRTIPLPVSASVRRGRRGVPAARSHHRHQPLRAGVEAQPGLRRTAGAPSSTCRRCPTTPILRTCPTVWR